MHIRITFSSNYYKYIYFKTHMRKIRLFSLCPFVIKEILQERSEKLQKFLKNCIGRNFKIILFIKILIN